MLNVTEVTFCGLQKVFIDGLYQWDYGQLLAFPELTLPSSYEVHFAQGEETCTVLGGEDGVEIPDIYLQTAETITAYIYLHQTEDDGETVYVVGIPVLARPEPSEGTPTPVEQGIITQAIAALNSAVAEADQYATNAEQSATEAQAYAQEAKESAESIDTSSFATKASLEAERQARISAVDSVGNAVTSVGNELRSEVTRAQSEEARIEGLTADTVKYTKQTLTDAQKRQALANLDAASNAALNGMSASFNASLGAVANRVTDEVTRATQAESSISASIPTSAQISALAPVQSVNGLTGAVTISTATTSANGLMSSQDKVNLDALYADYSSALSALGVS